MLENLEILQLFFCLPETEEKKKNRKTIDLIRYLRRYYLDIIIEDVCNVIRKS